MSGFCRPHPRYSWRKESLWWILEQACIWQDRHSLCRVGNREGLGKFDDGGNRNGEVLTKEEGTVYVRELELCFSKIHRQFFHSENSAKITGIITIGPVVKNNILSKMAGKIHRNTTNYVPFVVPGLSTSSSTSSSPTSPTSSSQDTVNATEYPASTRSESTSEEVQGNLSRGPAEAKNSHKNVDNVDVQGNLSHDLPEWLQEFRHGLVEENVPEHRDASSSSQELHSEPRAKVVSGKHSIFAHSRRTEIAICA